MSQKAIPANGSGDILSWAIDVDRLRLVLIRLSPADKEGAKLLIVDLRSGRVDKTAAVDVDTSNLIPTCGAVMLIDRVSGKMIDAVSGDAIEVPKGSKAYVATIRRKLWLLKANHLSQVGRSA